MKFIVGIGVLVVLVAVAVFVLNKPPKVEAPTNGTSSTSGNEQPTEWVNPYPDQIIVSMPRPYETVTASFGVTGKVRGFWAFEANLPMKLTEPNGTLISQTYTTVQGDWMTEDFVPFSAVIDAGSYRGDALLVIMRDNASGLPEHDREIAIPVVIGN
jgi:hypothetical protein